MKSLKILFFLIPVITLAQNKHPKPELNKPLYMFSFGINSSHIDLTRASANYSKHAYFGFSRIDKISDYMDLNYGVVLATRGLNTTSPNVKTKNRYIDIPISIRLKTIKRLKFEIGLNSAFLLKSFDQHLDDNDLDDRPERIHNYNYSRLLLEPNIAIDIKLHTDYSLNVKYSVLSKELNKENFWVGVNYIINHNNSYAKSYLNGISY